MFIIKPHNWIYHGSFVAPHRVQNLWPAISGLWQLLHDRRDLLERRPERSPVPAPAARLASVATAVGASVSPTGVPQVVQNRDLGRSGAKHLTHIVPPDDEPLVLLRFFLRLRLDTAAAGGEPVGVATAAAIGGAGAAATTGWATGADAATGAAAAACGRRGDDAGDE